MGYEGRCYGGGVDSGDYSVGDEAGFKNAVGDMRGGPCSSGEFVCYFRKGWCLEQLMWIGAASLFLARRRTQERGAVCRMGVSGSD